MVYPNNETHYIYLQFPIGFHTRKALEPLPGLNERLEVKLPPRYANGGETKIRADFQTMRRFFSNFHETTYISSVHVGRVFTNA